MWGICQHLDSATRQRHGEEHRRCWCRLTCSSLLTAVRDALWLWLESD